MSSVYHILDKIPALYEEDMTIEYEMLAQKLVNSGKLRIDTDLHRNFVLYADNNHDINLTVSKAELSDNNLLPLTQKKFEDIYIKFYSSNQLKKKLSKIFQNLNLEINKLVLPSDEEVFKLARIFVQSAHSIVIRWLFIDKVEVFITYSNNIGDVMDIVSWRQNGLNSGMQSTDGKNVAIFVSSGGDPLVEEYSPTKLSADGWCAIARMQIIGSQELGHFADIKRDEQGNQISRHSANFSGTKPTEITRKARKADIDRCNHILNLFYQHGLNKLIANETKLKFYRNNKITNFTVLKLKLISFFQRKKFIKFAKKNKFFFINKFTQDIYLGLMILRMIEDMKLNLTPLADVYKRSDKEAEEAISCIEALARVPQQSIKWGHITAAFFMHDLYKIYYKQVIPSLIHNYKAVTNSEYKPNYNIKGKKLLSFFKKLNIFSKSKAILKPVRETFNEANEN